MSPILTALPRSATGQLLTSYVSIISGQVPNTDGSPKELHIILMDNHRSDMVKDPMFKEALQCIRCATCLNVCPVFRLVGGHVFGKTYTGGIGTILTAWFDELKKSEDIQGLCRPFQQLGDSRQRAQGSGLGLAITQRIIQAMGGDLRVESILTRGSTFAFTLSASPGLALGPASVPIPDKPAIDLSKIHEILVRPELEELREFCRKGAMPALRKKLEEIARRQPDPVVLTLLELAKGFKIKSLKQILSRGEKP